MSEQWVVYHQGWEQGPSGWATAILVKQTEKSIVVRDGVRERRVMTPAIALFDSRDAALAFRDKARALVHNAEGGIANARAELERLIDKREAAVARLIAQHNATEEQA